jgi:hypothetical protein
MSNAITFRADLTDDPEFITIVERIAVRLFKQGNCEEVFLIEIKNWFDHKWLKFSGIGRVPFRHIFASQSQVALDEFYQEKITFPPFTPNRILRQQWHPAKNLRRKVPVHDTNRLREHSSWNLQRRVTDYANSALFVWFSSGTKANDRGSLLVYQVHDGSVSAWYASFRKAGDWVLHRTKEISREAVESLMATIPELNAAPLIGGPTRIRASRKPRKSRHR